MDPDTLRHLTDARQSTQSITFQEVLRHCPDQDIIRELVRRMTKGRDDCSRAGLAATPERVIVAWQEIFYGYRFSDADVRKMLLRATFPEKGADQMVVVRPVRFFATCLVGSTFVDTPRGRIPISRLKSGEWVYCWDEDENRMTLAKCNRPRITGTDKRLWRVFSDKDTVLCTGNHKFLTHNRGWVKARELVAGDSVVALNRGSAHYNDVTRSQIVWTGMSKQIPEHRFVFQEAKGVRLKSSDQVHHKNENPNDNRPGNLRKMTPSRHARHHRLTGGKTGFALFTDDQRKDMEARRLAGVRASQTEEVRKKRSDSLKAYWESMTPEQRAERNHRILSVERTDWREDVWCMDVPGYHNFVANGMVVHNCEHHLLSFDGTAAVGYVPNGLTVLGLSKLARLVPIFSRRLTTQERICREVTDALMDAVSGIKGAGCVVKAKHLCMGCRGANQPDAETVTSSLKGVLRAEPDARAEFLQLAGF